MHRKQTKLLNTKNLKKLIPNHGYQKFLKTKGEGKTTLLQLLAGHISPDSETCSREPTLSIGFLPQEITLADPSVSLRNYLEGDLLFELEQKMTSKGFL